MKLQILNIGIRIITLFWFVLIVFSYILLILPATLIWIITGFDTFEKGMDFFESFKPSEYKTIK